MVLSANSPVLMANGEWWLYEKEACITDFICGLFDCKRNAGGAVFLSVVGVANDVPYASYADAC